MRHRLLKGALPLGVLLIATALALRLVGQPRPATPAPPLPPARLGRLDLPRTFRAVVVQPKWTAQDFVSAARFRTWLRGQLEQARPHIAPDRPTLVVLTELNGMPLALRGAPLAARMPSLTLGLGLVLFKHLPAALWQMLTRRVSPVRGLLLAQAPDNAALYLSTCRDLAREYGVYLACGSGTLPHFRLSAGRLEVEGSGVFNTGAVFGPDGALIGLSDKVYLTPDEEAGGLDLTPGALTELRVFPTPVGDLGTAISLDAFKPDLIRHLEAQGATVLLQPDANASAWTDKEGLAPDPAHPRDQPVAWLESSWQAVQRSPSLRYALNPMVVGNLLGVPFDGQSAIVARADEAPARRSYVMTAPRPGFLALTPWVAGGTPTELRAVGAALAPGSGDPHENAYREDVLAADLRLEASTLPLPPPTPSETALRAWLAGRANLSAPLGQRLLEIGWPLAWLGLMLWGLRRRKAWGLLAALVAALTLL